VADNRRSRQARLAAEQALVRVVHHYGSLPEFVLIGGLVPQLLCAGSRFQHAGTTDVDVQVDLEIACGVVNTARLEKALKSAEFAPDGNRFWRWVTRDVSGRTVIKFELLADLEDMKTMTEFKFDQCDRLGAVNLRGTGFAAKDVVLKTLTAEVDSLTRTVQMNVTGLAGFLLSKTAAAYSRDGHKEKDWYDLAFVLLHNDDGGPVAAAMAVKRRFAAELAGYIRTALNELFANFATVRDQGPQAYCDQMLADHPELDRIQTAADAVVALEQFRRGLFD